MHLATKNSVRTTPLLSETEEWQNASVFFSERYFLAACPNWFWGLKDPSRREEYIFCFLYNSFLKLEKTWMRLACFLLLKTKVKEIKMMYGSQTEVTVQFGLFTVTRCWPDTTCPTTTWLWWLLVAISTSLDATSTDFMSRPYTSLHDARFWDDIVPSVHILLTAAAPQMPGDAGN